MSEARFGGSPETTQEAYIASITKVGPAEGEDLRSPRKIIITDERGNVKEYDASDTLMTIGANDEAIKITAKTAYHIYDRHLSGKMAGSQFPEGTTLKGIFDLIPQHFNLADIAKQQHEGRGPLLEHKFIGEIDFGKEQFITGVATMDEMLAKNIITQEQLQDFIDNYQDRINEANRGGDAVLIDEIKQEFNAKGYPIYLERRFPDAPLTPFFDTTPIATSKMTIIVIDRELITTMTGSTREKLPFPPIQKTLDYNKKADPEDYQRLITLFGSDEEILKKMAEEYPTNSQDWLQAGFIQRRTKE